MNKQLLLSFKKNDPFVEPIGGASPKFSARDKINAYSAKSSEILALDCPAQGFPVPAFRYFKLSDVN